MTKESVEKIYQHALSLYKAKEYSLALRENLSLLKLDPNFTDALNDVGLCYLELHQYTKARAFFEKASRLDPDNWVPYSNIANAYIERKKYKEALPYLVKAVKLGAREDIVYNLAVDYEVLATQELIGKSAERAFDYVNKAIATYPKDPDFFETKGNILLELNNDGEALKSFLKAKELGSESGDLVDKITDLQAK